MQELSLKDLMVEVGRNCNLACDHCIRGESQKSKLDVNKFEEFVVNANLKYIRLLMFTGGEPSLNPQAIEGVIDVLVRNNVEIGSWWISTNGLYHRKTYAFLRACARLNELCLDNDMSGLQISTGDFHQNDEVISFWNNFQDEDNWFYNYDGNHIFKSGMRKITNNAFSINFSNYSYRDTYLFNDGLAAENEIPAEKGLFYPWESSSNVEVYTYQNTINFGGDEPFYFASNGGIGIGCNFSYNRFDNELKVCNYNDFKSAEELIDILQKFNDKHNAEWEIDLNEEGLAA